MLTFSNQRQQLCVAQMELINLLPDAPPSLTGKAAEHEKEGEFHSWVINLLESARIIIIIIMYQGLLVCIGSTVISAVWLPLLIQSCSNLWQSILRLVEAVLQSTQVTTSVFVFPFPQT